MPDAKAWDRALLRDPHGRADKPARVRRMFAAIASSYDLNNRLHSLWLDQRWRSKAVELARVRRGDVVVDVACGTGDLAMKFAQAGAGRVIGVDFTWEMLQIAKGKAGWPVASGQWPASTESQSPIPNLKSKIQDPKSKIPSPLSWVRGDALLLPLADGSADVVSIAFGIRNVADPLAALREFARILRPGGRVVILEFSLPECPVARAAYNFYFRRILPLTATIISRDRTGAYRYLPESVNTFIGRDRMLELMRQGGFADVEYRPLTMGICVGYRGIRRSP